MERPSRRAILSTAIATAAGAAVGVRIVQAADAGQTVSQPVPTPTFRTKLRKAMIIDRLTEAALEPWKSAGFDGVEPKGAVPEADAVKGRAAADRVGLRIHSLRRGWAEFNSRDPALVATSISETEACLQTAAIYGADAVLVVPCKVTDIPMPEPWEFRIEFDESNGHVTRVADGDNEPYRQYIDAQNWATEGTAAAVGKLIPLAERLKVVIALENVWNNLWVEPALFRHFVASFRSPWVRAYYDIGNHVKYGRQPAEWVRTLGDSIAKCHVKDFRFEDPATRRKGGFVHPRDGHVDWPALRQALDDINYNGWLTIEARGLLPSEFNRRLDLIIAGR